uniref:t-SNARE coiled-coil homology domain-containing protein n=1 Tax=Alexandrium monilatum TaxID=311494 RepID=A0A7S4RHX1_9DINO|mmetsp:Transcript_34924/g.104516  ORF Transcript_34924/g.104516 Transcript_34924/m.104516 type:complete len:161 (+) Transcript_34924:120-602(+)|eukprot:CAMPEP_0175214142 /NCGR_PEP_ID=MMETSP0093-20121207/16552_1 /TAXON_ID=311494 /ORGANISM="Alexandrium monilatum, Strain CCMP3105" /LENGTH=160 /DNA_ID=CAMNT_0016507481 /DNA_START=115 /DNA_END=597 /DNA_ORIENTATION=+
MNRNANYSVRERMSNRFEVDQRAALFGSRFKGGESGKKSDDMYAAHSREMMERQNDAQIEDLEAKVSTLRDITKAIGKEAKDSNSLLDTMSIDFDKAGTLLKGTMSHLKTMMQQKNGKHMCYMVAFVLVLFFLMYFLRNFGSRSPGQSIELVQNSTADGN